MNLSLDLGMNQWRSPDAFTQIQVVGASRGHTAALIYESFTGGPGVTSFTPVGGTSVYAVGPDWVSGSIAQLMLNFQPGFIRPIDNPAFLFGVPWIHRILELHSRIQIELSAVPWLSESGILDAIQTVTTEIIDDPRLDTAFARVYSYLDPDTGAFRCVSITVTAEQIDFDAMRAIEAALRAKVRSLHTARRVVISVIPP